MEKVKIIAELSSNHMGDMSLIRDMVMWAKKSGADFVKFQTWSVSRLKPGPWDQDGRRNLYKEAELTKEKHKEVVKICQDQEIEFLTTCFCPDDLPFVRSLTNKVKIASTESFNDNLVTQAINQFDTVFISTGASKESEYKELAKYPNVYLLHCVSKYPCPSEMVNMPKMLHIASLTDRYGYSGHYTGIWDALLAISLGAKVIEKHFTIDKDLPFKDNKFSILPHELAKIREYADEYVKMLIGHGNDYQECEAQAREVYSNRWNA